MMSPGSQKPKKITEKPKENLGKPRVKPTSVSLFLFSSVGNINKFASKRSRVRAGGQANCLLDPNASHSMHMLGTAPSGQKATHVNMYCIKLQGFVAAGGIEERL